MVQAIDIAFIFCCFVLCSLSSSKKPEAAHFGAAPLSLISASYSLLDLCVDHAAEPGTHALLHEQRGAGSNNPQVGFQNHDFNHGKAREYWHCNVRLRVYSIC